MSGPAGGEWGAERLDIAAYLRRIGAGAPPAPTAAALAALHRAHVAAIAFENLDVVLGRGVDVDLPAVADKLVRRGRGGYCYEHGTLFAAALERLGFRVERLLARIGGDLERPRARSHMVVRVHADGRWWLADVGFGSGLLEPLPFGEPGPHAQGGWRYELVAPGDGLHALRERRGREWVTAYHFDTEPQHAADVVVANHFSSTHPASPFVARAVAVRKDEEGVHRLLGRELSVTRPDGSVQARQVDDAAAAAALRDVFGLPLDDEALAGGLGLEGGEPTLLV